MMHIEKAVLVIWIDHDYKIRKTLVYNTKWRVKATPFVRRFHSREWLKFIRDEAHEDFYLDDMEFDYILTYDWIMQVK